MSKLLSLPELYPPTRKAWRAWLAKHHASADGVWVICYKKASSQPTITYNELVEEALCYGWVDSKPNKIDEQKFKLLVTPRKPKSVWSAANKQRVAQLMQTGLMTAAGQAKIDVAQQNSAWDALNEVDTLTIPPDLVTAFKLHANAALNFSAFPPSAQKAILQWIASAKTAPTRSKRVTETAISAAHNVRANQWKPKTAT